MKKTRQPIGIPAAEFDQRFDDGEDITPYLDIGKATRPGRKTLRINVDFPSWMVKEMDKEASRLGVSRQALIKFVISNHLQYINQNI